MKIKDVKINNKNVPFVVTKNLLKVYNNSNKQFNVNIFYRTEIIKTFPQKFLDSENPASNLVSTISKEGVFLGKDTIWYPQTHNFPEKMKLQVTSSLDFDFVTEGKRLENKEFTNKKASIWEIVNPKNTLSIIGGPYIVNEKKIQQYYDLYFFI